MIMDNIISRYLNDQKLGALEHGMRTNAKTPVMATPAAVVAALLGKKVVGAAAAGATGIAAAYSFGRVVN